MDELVKLNEDVIDATSRAGSPSAYLVNMFPILRYWPTFLPGAGFVKDVEQGRNLGNQLFQAPRCMKQNEGVPSFLSFSGSSLIADDKRGQAAWAATATSQGAGVETSTSLLLSFILAMVHHPEVQKAAHQELDRVIPGRIPSIDDMTQNRLPYIDAVLTECYRWAPPGSFGLPHRLVKEDFIEGFTIPKDTIIMSNIRAIMYDEDIYNSPSRFLPERFLGEKKQPDPRAHVFGYGRRLCPGKNFAEFSLWLEIASLLAAFNILPALDDQGMTYLPEIKYTSGVMSRPEEFNCQFEPRLPGLKDLIMQDQP